MRLKTIALFLSINVISAVGFFTSSANAKSPVNINQASSSASIVSPLRLSSRTNFVTSYFGLSYVEIHNHTDWPVTIWIDRVYRGYIFSHRHLTLPVGSGKTVLQAQADCSCTSTNWQSTSYFDAGDTYSWVLD
jgi:hypothetical protein